MKITFYGAVEGVTGSCSLLEIGEKRLLIDCGMFQGAQYCDLRNMQPLPFDAKSIDAVFITHPHVDHTGRLPKLVHEGYEGPVYITEPAAALGKIVLEDAIGIMEENSRRCDEPILYNQDDLQRLFRFFETTNYHRTISIDPNITVMFHD
ncbi:MAG: MBL fold metallo-hydrolase, partial [bacterium]|nr:MBL fold metallo-hydrolase [bacterium]